MTLCNLTFAHAAHYYSISASGGIRHTGMQPAASIPFNHTGSFQQLPKHHKQGIF